MVPKAEPVALDPNELDAIVAELDLTELGLWDRTLVWLDELRRSFVEWLEGETNSEWLKSFARWLDDFSFDGVGGELGLFEFVVLSILGMFLIACGYGLYRLWRSHRPRRAGDAEVIEALTAQGALQMELAEMSPRRQAAAVIARIGLDLHARGQLELRPGLTNLAIAHRAEVTEAARCHLTAMAVAADRALFGGWSPKPEALHELRENRTQFYQLLDEQHSQAGINRA